MTVPIQTEEAQEAIQELNQQIRTLQEKIDNGRIRNKETETIRLKYHRVAVQAYQAKADMLQLTNNPHGDKTNKVDKSLYIISGGGLDKIGVSKDPDARLQGLRGASPVELRLRYKSKPCNNALIVEDNMHNKYKEYNHHCEWFELPDGMLSDVIEDIEREINNDE